MAGEVNAGGRLLNVDPQTDKFARRLISRCMFRCISQPLRVCRVLIQLGHEPFPTTTGKRFLIFGRDVQFYPNIFSYMYQLSKKNGLSSLWTGLDADIVGFFLKGIIIYKADKIYRSLFEKNMVDNKLEGLDLAVGESFNLMVRRSVREVILRRVAVILTRPITVVMIRQIAQLIGNETKYGSVISSLKLIAENEGANGLFAGIVPQIIADTCLIWGINFLTFGLYRLLLKSTYSQSENRRDISISEAIKVKSFVNTVVPFFMNWYGQPLVQPYNVVSCVLSVAGSGLVASLIPYSPAVTSWHDGWNILYPNGLWRGSNLFLREQVRSVTM